MINFTRDSKDLIASVIPSLKNDSVNDMIDNGRGIYLCEIRDGNKHVTVFEGYQPLEVRKQIKLMLKNYVISASGEILNSYKIIEGKSTWAEDVYTRLEPVSHNAEGIHKRVINGLLEMQGLAYLYNPLTLELMDNELEAIAYSPHLA